MSHGSECNSSMRKNMSEHSFNTMILDNSHDPKNDDDQAFAIRPDVDSSVHVYIAL